MALLLVAVCLGLLDDRGGLSQPSADAPMAKTRDNVATVAATGPPGRIRP